MGGAFAHGSQPPRVLRVSRGNDGALGWSRGDRVHRRPRGRSDARSERLAPGALHRHRRRPRDHGLRVRRAARARGEDRQEVALAARQDVPRRPRARPHHRRQGAEGFARGRAALQGVGRADHGEARRSARACRKGGGAERVASRSAAGVRLFAGGPEVHPAADGCQRRGADGLDGQRRAARGALVQEQEPVPVLQATVRAGHEPADRPDSRRASHEPRLVRRSEAEPARHRRDESAAPARGEPAGARRRRHGDDPSHRTRDRRQVQELRARHHLSRRVGQGGDRGPAREPCGAGRGRGALGLFDPRPLRSQDGRRPRRDSSAARALGDPPAPDQQGLAHADRPRGRNGLRARGASLCTARRIRRRGGAPLPRVRNARRPRRARQAVRGRRRQEGGQELRQGDRQGPAQGDVEDGHLHVHVLHRRADLRGGGPLPRARRQVLQRHHVDGRGNQRVRRRRGGDSRAQGRVQRRSGARARARRRRRVRIPRPRRGAHVDAGRHREAAALGACELPPDLRGVREDHQPARCRSARSRPRRTRRSRSR
ncbi:MAG: hypothetical protein H6R20_985 [Proteobacteria bacterium]|nr:hypothetical protein [Pseudomonadota bacterium]